jgi:hypothetical protein
LVVVGHEGQRNWHAEHASSRILRGRMSGTP